MIRREILKEVLLDNRNEVVKHQVIPRSFQFEEFGNYVFVGIRRAGKSFLLYQRIQELLHSGHTWNEMLYVNFEDERLIGMTAADLNLILEVHAEMSTDRPMLFLDEIQNIDGWDKFVRRLADNKYRAYVTGSNAKMLSQDVATTLGGRYITVHVYPYDFKEFLYANEVEVTENSLFATESRAEIKRIFNDYFRSGGFPEGASLAAKRDYLTSVYQKIYLGDIAARHSIENTFALRILFRKLAESIKQPSFILQWRYSQKRRRLAKTKKRNKRQMVEPDRSLAGYHHQSKTGDYKNHRTRRFQTTFSAFLLDSSGTDLRLFTGTK